ncbi:MAG: class I SAM-dependent rRNA methyltransferase [Chloroflexi bacterium]|nr:class I SAM-dependent rRNA methyltransferase [Chloroflexota bacterium]
MKRPSGRKRQPSGLPVVQLRRDLARALRAGHPWLFADALAAPMGLAAGSVVEVHDARGNWLARGIYDPDSPIAVRVWSLDRDEPLDASLLRRRLRGAAALRRSLLAPTDTDAYRLAHGEGDRLPGLICDIYADTAVIQLDSPALAPWLTAAAQAIGELLPGLARIALREARQPEPGGPRWLVGEAPAERLVVREHGMLLEADVEQGHKTGLYLDQRESRRRIRELAAGRRVLNTFAYTGAFSVAAALGGAASVTTLDQAAPAVEAARRNFALNGLDPDAYRFIGGDAFAFLAEDAEHYDLVIVDPPSMAASRANLDRALSAYRRLNIDALHRCAPGALLLSASCSSHVSADQLRGILAEAGARAGRSLRILEARGAGPDHPTLPAFPEGDYLHAFLVHVA